MPGFDLTERSVFSIGMGANAGNYSAETLAFDYAVAGLPFMSFASPEIPMERALAPVRKQQVDQSDNPGEQSLDSWWLRSQTDWSGGAGMDFMEPASDARVQRRFYASAGVNVWDIGQVSLLRSLSSVRTLTGSAASYVRKYSSSGTTGLYFGSGSNIDRWNGSTWASTTGFSGTLAGMTVAGSKLLAWNTTGGIYSADAGSTTLSSLWTTSNGATKSWWVKQRLITAQGAKLWELSLTGGNLDTTSAYYTHPDSTWTWTAAFEAPGAILVAGYGAAGSAVYKFVLQTSGALPTISGAITTAELPVGEYITDGFTYLGAYVALATNLGIRVGTVAANGDITYGPFTYEGATVGGFQAYSRFVYTGVADAGDGRAGLIRIDLSDIGEDGRAPWANDVRFAAGGPSAVQSIAVLSDQQVYLASAGDLHGCTAASNLESSGWLTTGYIRYGTIEKKNFDSVAVEMDKPIYGTLQVASVDKDAVTTNLGTFGGAASLDDELSVGYPPTPQRHLALKFTLNRDGSDATKGPVLENWQLKALPSTTRRELQQIPLMLFDFEEDQFGQRWGYEGAALVRWMTLRDAVRDSSTVTLQNFNTGESTTCVVDELSFRQTASPARASGFGGVVLLTIRDI